jgi:acyl carrier protein
MLQKILDRLVGMKQVEELRYCFRQALNLPPEAEVDALEYAKQPVWDSVAHMRLVAAIEQEFNVMFSTDQILDMSSFGKACSILDELGVPLAA